jgi:HAD superfamily hydrolase (TIGR01509 family)
VTFDAGQTLIDLDLDFLALRLRERGVRVEPPVLAAAMPAAWRHYDEVVGRGEGNTWQAFMRALLAGGGVGERLEELVTWLRAEQPVKNLWRKPIVEMVTLARDLRAQGVRVAVLSNSEGRLAELLDEIGIGDAFEVVVDSMRVGVEKPDPRIFALTLARLGATAVVPCVHVGDSWAADVEGALAAGWRAIWFRSHVPATAAESARHRDVALASDVDDVRAALRAFGVLH